MGKKIWIVNYYTASPNKASNPRYLEFSDYFRSIGHEVITFNSSVVEELAQTEDFVAKDYGPFHFIHVKSPKYVGNGLKRMWSIWTFAWRLFVHRRQFEKPDVILHNLHTPFDYPVFWLARKWRVRYIAEAWDMWPEDFVTFGFLSASNPAMRIAYRMEKHLYEKADGIVFTFEGGLDYLKEKGWTSDRGGRIDINKVHYINSGVNLKKFDEDVILHPRDDEDLIDPSLFRIVYLGSIRLVNNVKQLIDAANILQSNPRYRFFIYGDGTDREYLEEYVKENGILNVVFKEKQIPFEEVAWVVSQATVNVMNYQKNFGIHGVSSGKMFQYFAAGKPICCNIKLNYSEISRRNLGVDRDLETPGQYAEAIRMLVEQPQEEYNAMCKRVRATAAEYDYLTLSAREAELL